MGKGRRRRAVPRYTMGGFKAKIAWISATSAPVFLGKSAWDTTKVSHALFVYRERPEDAISRKCLGIVSACRLPGFLDPVAAAAAWNL